MNREYLTAPCGLDCFNCPTYEENIKDEYREQTAKLLKIPADEVPCKGCRDELGNCKFAPESKCDTFECADNKGVTFCYECDEFPCVALMPTLKGATFPQNMKLYNLCRIKNFGLDKWIDESKEIRKRYYKGEFLVGRGPQL